MPFGTPVDRLKAFRDYVNDAMIGYHPLMMNSNSFAFEAPTALGLPRPKPEDYPHAPGSKPCNTPPALSMRSGRMAKRIGLLVTLIGSQLLLPQLNSFAAQDPTGAKAGRACTGQQAQDLLRALESRNELDSVLGLLGERKIEYSVVNQTRPYDRRSDLQRLRQEGGRYHLHIAFETAGILGFMRTADVVSVEFEGTKLIARSCGKVLTAL